MLKKNIMLIITLLAVICGLSFAQERQVYIVGSDGNNAVYWLNGKQIVLPKSSDSAETSGIAVSGANIYIAGTDGNDAVYWLNGRRTILPKSSNDVRAYTTAIAVSGSDVYIVGVESRSDNNGRRRNSAVYWLNGRQVVLPNSSGQAVANDIAVSGSNIYIVGRDGDWGESDAVYWLNGRRTVLSKSSNNASANAIAVSGSDVYIGGNDVGAVYWFNGRQIVLSQLDWGDMSWASPSTGVGAIAISGSNIHFAGSSGLSGEFFTSKPVYWLNGNITELPKIGGVTPGTRGVDESSVIIGEASANAIAISGSDVYIVGYDGKIMNSDFMFRTFTTAVYWLNGERYALPSSNESRTIGIAIIE